METKEELIEFYGILHTHLFNVNEYLRKNVPESKDRYKIMAANDDHRLDLVNHLKRLRNLPI